MVLIIQDALEKRLLFATKFSTAEGIVPQHNLANRSTLPPTPVIAKSLTWNNGKGDNIQERSDLKNVPIVKGEVAPDSQLLHNEERSCQQRE